LIVAGLGWWWVVVDDVGGERSEPVFVGGSGYAGGVGKSAVGVLYRLKAGVWWLF
jgi:hypothetical protein